MVGADDSSLQADSGLLVWTGKRKLRNWFFYETLSRAFYSPVPKQYNDRSWLA